MAAARRLVLGGVGLGIALWAVALPGGPVDPPVTAPVRALPGPELPVEPPRRSAGLTHAATIEVGRELPLASHAPVFSLTNVPSSSHPFDRPWPVPGVGTPDDETNRLLHAMRPDREPWMLPLTPAMITMMWAPRPVHWVVAETSAALAPAIEPWAPGAVLGDISLYPQNTRRLLAAAEADGYWPPNERALATPEGLRVVLAVSEMALMSTIPLDDDPNDLNIQEDPNHPGPLARRLAGRHPGTPVGDALAGEQRLEGARSSEGTLDPVVYTQAIADLTTNPGPALYVLLDRYVLLPNDALAAIDAVIARGGPYAEPALRLRARDAALRGDRAGLARWIAMFDALTPAAFPDDATRLLAARDWDEARVVARGPSESESWQEAVQQATRACIPVQEWVAETELSARWDGAAWTLTRADGLPVACSFQPARAPTGPTVATVRLW